MPKKKVHLSLPSAMKRLAEMTALIQRDIEIAAHLEASLQAANAIVTARNIKRPGKRTYLRIVEAQRVHLAACLSRLVDSGTPWRSPNQRDVASLPLAIHFLRQKRCRDRLAATARNSAPVSLADANEASCRQSSATAIRLFSEMRKQARFRWSIKRLKQFRNFDVAHALIKPKEHGDAKYDDLFNLGRALRPIATHVIFAVQDKWIDLDDTKEILDDDATRYWRSSFGLAASDD